MNAIQIDRYGGPDELVWREVAPRRLAPLDVRIRTAYAAVNRADLEIRSGRWPIVRQDPFPHTPGLEVVGEIEEVGSAVTGVAPGGRVITMMQRLGGIWGERPGGYAELVDVAADAVATIPADVGLELTGWSSENLDGDELRSHVAEIAELVRAGRLGAPAIERYEMAEAAAAHRAMERGGLTGRALLVA